MRSYSAFLGVLGELVKTGYSANSSTNQKGIFIFLINFYGSKLDLQCCVSSYYAAK